MLIKKFIDYLNIEKGYSEHTLVAYQNDLEVFSEFVETTFEISKLSEVQYIQIRSWVVELIETDHKSTSINRKMSALKSFYKFLLKTGDIDLNPMSNHKALKQDKKIVIPFSQKEMQRLFDLMAEHTFTEVRDKLVIELLYTTGMRRTELSGLKTDDIDLATRQIKVLGKRKKERILPLLDNTKRLLEKYLRFKNELPEQSPYLMLTDKGKPITNHAIYKIVKEQISKVSSKDKRSPHVLRHAFATHLLDEGLDLNSVKELLGHASLASTQVYTHSSLKKIKNVYQKTHPRNQ